MAKINLNDAFLTTKVKNDTEIERATTKNVSRISQSDIQEIHQNLMRVLNNCLKYLLFQEHLDARLTRIQPIIFLFLVTQKFLLFNNQ